MTDDRSTRLRDLEVRISQWEGEHRLTLQRELSVQRSLEDTLSLAMRVSILGSGPSVAWILCWVAASSATLTLLNYALVAFGVLVIFCSILVGAARASGLVAHWWFRSTAAQERLATIVLALLADAVIYGWILVELRF